MFRGPFMWRGVTLAIFHSLGKICEVIELLITIKGKEITGAANLSTFAEILSIPVVH